VRIALLGPLEICDADGTPVDVVGDRVRTLLARLALSPGRPVPFGALVDAVWADDPPAGELNALQSLVSRLRRALPADLAVQRSAAGYRLAVDPADVDVGAFERLLDGGTADLDRALRLWRGEPLCDVDGQRVAPATVARLVQRRLAALEDRAEARLSSGGPAVASELADELAELVAGHPLRERARALRMRALWVAGRPAEALDEYARLAAALAGELGTDPSPGLRDLHAAMLRGTHIEPVPAAPRGNLRAALTSFVGRTGELDRVGLALATARLVTLVGPGGAGKTRLATEVGAGRVLGTGDEVWLVELAGVTEPAEVPAAVLSTLDLGINAGLAADRSPTGRLLEELRGRRALLVLDNCEHLLTACAELAVAVLGGCPDVVVLATSREPLAVTGEVLVPVGPLPVPPSDVDLEAALAYPSVRLFADRMAAVRPGLTVTADTLAPVLELCRRLDGLPLAIELACARLRTMPLAELAGRLSDRFRLLTGGSRTALPRHRTLLAVVGWSWDLFDEAERALARRLAVFAGGASLDAVEAVCGADAVSVLGALVDKSFVDFDGLRYRMLDTVRAYAADALAGAGEADTVRAAHAAYFLGRAEAAEPELRGHDQLRWLAYLEREYENLTAALRWATDRGDVPTALRFGMALGWFWFLRGGAGEAESWLAEALARSDAVDVDPAVLAGAYAYGAMMAFGVGDLDRARACADRARRLALATDPPPTHPAVAFVSALAVLESFDLASVFTALSRLADQPDPWVAAAGRLVRGHAAETFGDLDGAVGWFAQGHGRFVALGDRWGAMLAVSALAGGRSLAGDHAGAIEALTAAEALAAAVGADSDAAWARGRRGVERWRAGDLDGAAADLGRARADGRRRRSAVLTAMAEAGLADVARSRSELDEAQELLTGAVEALAGAPGALPPRLRVTLATGQARLDLARGDPAAARRSLDAALAGAVHIGDGPTVAGVAEAAAELVLAEGDLAGAAHVLGLAAAVRGALDQGSPGVRSTLRAAGCQESTVDTDAAVAKLAALLRE
jgi:predicted ATPase/DNA-binding SARP family transcriptional activator